jgi:hypothetical protein
MPRPCSPHTRFFSRPLSDEQRAILLAAGQGDLSIGFAEVLVAYAALWKVGYRPGNSDRFFLNKHVKDSV